MYPTYILYVLFVCPAYLPCTSGLMDYTTPLRELQQQLSASVRAVLRDEVCVLCARVVAGRRPFLPCCPPCLLL